MKISQEVLAVLSRCEVADVFGLRLPPSQLDRKLYLKVNEVLEALGGKWSRKLKVHIFTKPVEGLLDDALLTGEVDRPADHGFFETPEALADELVAAARIEPGMHVLEPSAGRGRIVRAIRAAAPDCMLFVCELQQEHFPALNDAARTRASIHIGDFMETPYNDIDRVVMNPPFAKGAAVRHIGHALGMLRTGGRLVSVAPASVMFREDNLHRNFRAMVKEHRGTITELPEGAFKASGTMVRTCVVTIDKQPQPLHSDLLDLIEAAKQQHDNEKKGNKKS